MSILPNNPGPLDQEHAYCTSSADIIHPQWGCFLDEKASTPTQRVFRKVTHPPTHLPTCLNEKPPTHPPTHP